MIHLLLGSTGAGKSHYAAELATRHSAIHFAVDEWMKRLFFPDLQEDLRFEWAMERVSRCEEMIWQTAQQVLACERDVILEVSMSTRALRDAQRQRALQTGHSWRLYYLDVDSETRWQRVQQRNQQRSGTWSFDVSREQFDFVEQMFEPPSAEELMDAVVIRG